MDNNTQQVNNNDLNIIKDQEVNNDQEVNKDCDIDFNDHDYYMDALMSIGLTDDEADRFLDDMGY